MKKIISLLLLLNFSIKAQDVRIGNQVWTSKNLDVSTYSNGDDIPEVQDKTAWQNLETGAWCYYENKAENGTKYGKLYNWFAVNDPRGLAPKGYHIPKDKEWTILIEYLGGGLKAGTKMKSTSGWLQYFDSFKIIRSGNGTNTYDFSGLPGGVRDHVGDFGNVEALGFWWSSSVVALGNDRSIAYYRTLSNQKSSIYNYDFHSKKNGFSVRCLRD